MKHVLILLAALSLGGATLTAQDYMVPELADALREDRMRCGGNLIPYSHGDLTETPAPRGYKPFYISHYARHGSRHTWGDKGYLYVLDILGKADSLGILSPAGRKVMDETLMVMEAWDGMDGRLSQRGVREHQEMAHRMVKRFPEVFRGSPRIRAIGSTVQRSLISMNAFTTAIAADRPRTRWTMDTGEKFMNYIGDTGHATPDVKELRATIKDRKWDFQADTSYVLGRLFTDSLAAARLVPEVNKFNYALFNVATITRCWDIEDYILDELSFEWLYQTTSNDSHYVFAKYGNAAEITRERLASAHELADDILAKADEVISSGEYAVDLRFGHDYPLHTLVAYIGIEGPGSKLAFDEIDKYWWQWRELCMGSNLQMIFYRNKAGRVLVKFLYQEQERMLRGLESVSGPYYDWETVRANFDGFRR